MLKKIFLLLLIFLSATFSYGFDFMNVPVEGSLDTFVQGLQDAGLTERAAGDEMVLLSGTCYGQDNCLVAALARNGAVSGVVLMNPPKNSWENLRLEYYKFKNKMTSRNGEPYSEKESFDADESLLSDSQKLSELKAGRVHYYSAWRKADGTIIKIGLIDMDPLGYRLAVAQGYNESFFVFEPNEKTGDAARTRDSDYYGKNRKSSNSTTSNTSYTDSYKENAQTSSNYVSGETGGKHLNFLDTPIDGSVEWFTRQMQNKSYSVVQQGTQKAVMKGSFTGFGDCYLYVNASGGRVYQVTVALPEQFDWTALYNNYNSVREFFVINNGNPAETVEKFDCSERDGLDKYECFKSGKADVHTKWELTNGDVVVKMQYTKGNACFVSIVYTDGINAPN